MKKKKWSGFIRVTVLCLLYFVIVLLSGCAFVTKGYQLYPLGVSVKTNSSKSIYIQPAFDKRPDNMEAAMFLGDITDDPTKYITRFEHSYYFVEDKSVQSVSEFFTGAVKNDFRAAGFEIANSKNSADYVLIMQINKMDGHKEMNMMSQITGIFTLGFTTYYDVVTIADVNVMLKDAKTNRKIFSKRYRKEESKEQYIRSPFVFSTEYFLTKQIKLVVKQMLTDAIKISR